MPRLGSLLRRRPQADSGQPAGPRAIRRPLPAPNELRRERRALIRIREDRLRDLGGLMLEMYRRDQFRQDLLVDRCSELIALDARLGEIDALLSAALSVRRRPAARCECGVPIRWGSRYCSSCGRELVPTEAG